MTTRTDAILKFIRTFHAAHGYAPTRMEIGRSLHLSTSVVSYHLVILQDAGRLTVARNIARGIVLAEKDEWARLGMTSPSINPSITLRTGSGRGDGGLK